MEVLVVNGLVRRSKRRRWPTPVGAFEQLEAELRTALKCLLAAHEAGIQKEPPASTDDGEDEESEVDDEE